MFYNIDALNVAIHQGGKVSTRMMEYGMDQELVKREDRDVQEYIHVDLIKDIVILERGIDIIFGGFNPGQYAKEHIFQKSEKKKVMK